MPDDLSSGALLQADDGVQAIEESIQVSRCRGSKSFGEVRIANLGLAKFNFLGSEIDLFQDHVPKSDSHSILSILLSDEPGHDSFCEALSSQRSRSANP